LTPVLGTLTKVVAKGGGRYNKTPTD